MTDNKRVPFDKLYTDEGARLDALLAKRGDPPERVGPPRKSPAEVKQLIDSHAMMFWGSRGYPPNGRAQAWVDARATPLDLSRPANSDNPTLEILESLALDPGVAKSLESAAEVEASALLAMRTCVDEIRSTDPRITVAKAWDLARSDKSFQKFYRVYQDAQRAQRELEQ